MDVTRKMSRSEIEDLAAVLTLRMPQGPEEYARKVIAQRDQLVEAWRLANPAAAAEQSAAFHPLIPMPEAYWKTGGADEPEEYWHNDVYTVAVRRHAKDPVFDTDGGMIQLGISSIDGSARHDWRDMQAIKNQLAGAECEGFELFPAESRLLDPSNYYTLWCFPGLRGIRVGTLGRKVRDAGEALAPQRKLSLSKSEWIERYGGQYVLDREGLEVVACDPATCADPICHGWRVQRKGEQ